MKVRNMVYTAMLAAAICVLAPISIPTGVVSITLATLAIYLVCSIAGWKRALIAVIVYILLGAVGLPVFSNFSGGLQHIVGPTGGYIVGYIPMTIVIALMIDKSPEKKLMYPIAMIVGTLIVYTFGTAWYVLESGKTLAVALATCVVPFLAGDALKIAAVSLVAPRLRVVLGKFLKEND